MFFPGGPVVKYLSANARDKSSILSLGRSQMPQSNLSSTITEACTPRACAPQKEKPLQWEAHAPQLESSHHSLQLEKACTHTHTHTHTRLMFGALSERCWFSKHTSKASVADNRNHSCCLKPKRVWFKSQSREANIWRGDHWCSGQRCFTRILWCLDPEILAAPSWLTAFFRTGGQQHQVVCLSWCCACLQQAIYSTFQKISYFWIMRSMVKPENPRAPTHWLIPFAVGGFVIRNNAGFGTSLVVQWLRIHFAMQRMWVWSLVGELRVHVTWGS